MLPSEKKEYKVVNGTYYDKRTPDDLVSVLESVRQKKERVVLVYGNVETGEVWESATTERGTIGRSTGSEKIPLLVRTSRSLGGEAILDYCILQVLKSRGGEIIYQRREKSR